MKNYIAIIGQNPNFIAFMAHSMAVAYVLTKIQEYWHPSHVAMRLIVGAIVALAAIKEFYFDLRYEKNPPQTIEDSLMDFAGYMVGIALVIL